MTKKIGVYPGSFDPFTLGHLDILLQAAALLDHVIVAVLVNNSKQPFFTLEERVHFIENVIEEKGLSNVTAGHFSGLLVNYVQLQGAQCIIRGLRNELDFQYETQLYAANSILAPEITTIYLLGNPSHSYISSSLVRELGSYQAPIETMVSKSNHQIIAERLKRR